LRQQAYIRRTSRSNLDYSFFRRPPYLFFFDLLFEGEVSDVVLLFFLLAASAGDAAFFFLLALGESEEALALSVVQFIDVGWSCWGLRRMSSDPAGTEK